VTCTLHVCAVAVRQCVSDVSAATATEALWKETRDYAVSDVHVAAPPFPPPPPLFQGAKGRKIRGLDMRLGAARGDCVQGLTLLPVAVLPSSLILALILALIPTLALALILALLGLIALALILALF
jgi:hypothetical protein